MQANISMEEYENKAKILAYEVLKLKRQIMRNKISLIALVQNYNKGDEEYSKSSVMAQNIKCMGDIIKNNDFRNSANRIKELSKKNAEEQRKYFEDLILPECVAIEQELKTKEEEFKNLYGSMFVNNIGVNSGISQSQNLGAQSQQQAQSSNFGTQVQNGNPQSQQLPAIDKELSESITKISEAQLFEKIIKQRKSQWNKIAGIRTVRLTNKKYTAQASEMKKLREAVKEKDKQVKEYIHEFSLNQDYQLTPELQKLIGVREDTKDKRIGEFGATLMRPTVKQHLEPIESIEKQLKEDKLRELLTLTPDERNNILNDTNKSKYEKDLCKEIDLLPDAEKNRISSLQPLSENEKKKLEDEKAKRERRLGEKWKLKLKIDRLNEEIKNLKNEYKNASDDRKLEIEKLLVNKNVELEKLEKEYGKILEDIAQMIVQIVERTECAKHGVTTFEELKQKTRAQRANLSPVQPTGQGQIQSASAQPTGQGQIQSAPAQTTGQGQIQSVSAQPTGQGQIQSAPAQTTGQGHIQSAPAQPTGQGHIQSATAQPTGQGQTQALISKQSIWERLLHRTMINKQAPVEILQERLIENDSVYERSQLPVAKIENGMFYHTIVENGKLEYVREPLENIDCSRRAIINKIKEIQDYWKNRDITKEVPSEDIQDMRYNLSVSARTLYSRCIGFGGKRRRQEMMCGILAAGSMLEAMYGVHWGVPRDVEQILNQQLNFGARNSVNPGVTAPAPANTGVTAPAPANTGVTAPAPTNPGVTAPAPVNTGVIAPAPVNTGVTAPASTNPGVIASAPTNTGVTAPASTNLGVTTSAPPNSGAVNQNPVNPRVRYHSTVSPGVRRNSALKPGLTNRNSNNTNTNNIPR